jgi:hypothetical protein
MTKGQFRAGIVLSLGIAFLGLAVSWLAEPGLPAALREYQERYRAAPPSARDWALVAFLVPLSIAGVASLVGLLRFRRWSRPLALSATVGNVALMPFFGPVVDSGLANALYHLSSMLYGGVLAAAYFSPAAEWFRGGAAQ